MRRVLLVLATAALASGAVASSATASHSWNGYHWARPSNPFTIKVGDNVSSAWDGYLTTASVDWSANTGGNPLNTTVVAGRTTGRRCRATVGRVEVCNAAYGSTGWLGIASISVNGSHITQGTAKMNDTYYATAKYNTPFWRGAVMCQEVGHSWGLGHQDESGADLHTCMDYASAPDADNTKPNRHDYDQLTQIYAHLDGSTTIGLSAQSGARPYRTERTDRRRTSRVVERFSDGSQRITFIYWAV